MSAHQKLTALSMCHLRSLGKILCKPPIESLTVGATINSFHKSSGISYFSITSLLKFIKTLNTEQGDKKSHYPKSEEVCNQNIFLVCSFCICFGIYLVVSQKFLSVI